MTVNHTVPYPQYQQILLPGNACPDVAATVLRMYVSTIRNKVSIASTYA